MNRYELRLTGPDATRYSFTWAESPEAAKQRVADQMAEAPEVWAGWTAEVI
ncbi:hypothetical protein ACIRP5_10090 [Streptomyces sp. NPDC101221]|uniref:hypothetical protein n=1 Tax=Streptomyces sp. NPDC101221 TaxID=3366132 RepID=UPI00380ADB78